MVFIAENIEENGKIPHVYLCDESCVKSVFSERCWASLCREKSGVELLQLFTELLEACGVCTKRHPGSVGLFKNNVPGAQAACSHELGLGLNRAQVMNLEGLVRRVLQTAGPVLKLGSNLLPRPFG